MPMYNPSHPGPIILDACMKPLGLSVSDAAKKLGVPKKQLDDVINCKGNVTAEMAIRLSKAFGSSADTWYGIQTAYDLFQAKKYAHKIKIKLATAKPTAKAA